MYLNWGTMKYNKLKRAGEIILLFFSILFSINGVNMWRNIILAPEPDINERLEKIRGRRDLALLRIMDPEKYEEIIMQEKIEFYAENIAIIITTLLMIGGFLNLWRFRRKRKEAQQQRSEEP